MNLGDVEKLTQDDIQEALNIMPRATRATVDHVVGFVQIRPQSERTGKRFKKKSTANARKDNRKPRRRGV